LFVVAGHGRLDQFDPVACKFDYCFDQSPPNPSLSSR